MLQASESAFVVIAVMAASLAFLFALDRCWPSHHRRKHNDAFAWQVNFLGMTYGVIISFMLFAAWTSFSDAITNANGEANAAINLSRLSDTLPQAQGDSVRALTRSYVDVMLNDEWPAMTHNQLSPKSHELIQQLWYVLSHTLATSQAQQVGLDHAFIELSSMTEHRRIRQEQALQHLPGILWAVLLLGSVLTVSYACLFGAENLKLHAIQVGGLSLLIALSLAAIADLSRPYQGAAHVEPYGFLRAQETLNAATETH
ncbi:DUF4239 domain-containing protein [Alloacidobacterium dinghuense]|uniref:DUF4239 domain-containing protein n=1 Tax=Alloacidobacterium dinghuense TaxID=2763107 RepID=A0A7G8BGU0_9BACT|nr:DUF4239 domain-containing protein [Alloacidobacterium dinghuense]QNI31760.1 DUF4239 domain-containing protein [Alloacidobacterium dinghuense]